MTWSREPYASPEYPVTAVGVGAAPHLPRDRVDLRSVRGEASHQPPRRALPGRQVRVGGSSRSCASDAMWSTASTRKPSTPPSNQNRSTSSISARTSGVPPVQRRLRRQMDVQVVLPGRVVEGPCRSAELAHPVVRRATIGPRVGPHVPVTVGVLSRRAGRNEPWVLSGRVTRDEVEHHPEPTIMARGQQPVEVPERAEQRVDARVVGDCQPKSAIGDGWIGEIHTASTPRSTGWSRSRAVSRRTRRWCLRAITCGSFVSTISKISVPLDGDARGRCSDR